MLRKLIIIIIYHDNDFHKISEQISVSFIKKNRLDRKMKSKKSDGEKGNECQ